MKNIKTYLCAIIFALITNSAIAQNTLTGSVSTTNSNPINEANIYIPDVQLSATSNANGAFTMHNVPNGSYLVVISKTGFASQTKEITVSQTASINIVLEPSIVEMKKVIVTGVANATELKTNPTPINILGKNDMLQNSSTNIIDAISATPGVSQMTHGPSISKPFIRGLGYNRVVVLNDGVRQEGQQWFDEFGEEIDEYTVNKVEVLKGPASLSYGSDAMAGVINLIDAPTVSEGSIKGNLLSNYQSNNGLLASTINMAGNIKGIVWDVRYTGKMAHCYQNKYDSYVANSGYSESNGKAMIGINRSWGFSHLILSKYDMQTGIIEGARDTTTGINATGKFTQHYLTSSGNDTFLLSPDAGFTKYYNYPVIHQHIRHYKAVLDNSFALGSGRLHVRLGMQQNLRQEANDIVQGIYNNYFHLNTNSYDVRYLFAEKNKLEMSVGVNGMSQNSKNLGTAFVIPEYTLFDFGAFAIAKKTINNLAISGGLRVDTRTLKGKNMWVDSMGARVPAGTADAIENFTAYTSHFSGVSGSIGATYNFTKELYAKANIARGYRAPTASESGANGIHDGTPYFEIGDHNLKAETSTQIDGTVGFVNTDITIEANLFANHINNYIFATKLESVYGGDSIRRDYALPEDVGTGPAFKFTQGNAVLTGGEMQLDIHPKTIKWAQLNNSFSWVNAVQKNQPDSTKYLPFTPPAKCRSELKLMLPNRTSLQNAYFKIGVDAYMAQNKVYYKDGNETKTPAYTLLNAGIGGNICNAHRTLFSLYLTCTNLTDVAYQSNMSRLKYTDVNNVTGRTGVYNMGRNFSFKLNIPLDIKK